MRYEPSKIKHSADKKLSRRTGGRHGTTATGSMPEPVLPLKKARQANCKVRAGFACRFDLDCPAMCADYFP